MFRGFPHNCDRYLWHVSLIVICDGYLWTFPIFVIDICGMNWTHLCLCCGNKAFSRLYEQETFLQNFLMANKMAPPIFLFWWQLVNNPFHDSWFSQHQIWRYPKNFRVVYSYICLYNMHVQWNVFQECKLISSLENIPSLTISKEFCLEGLCWVDW